MMKPMTLILTALLLAAGLDAHAGLALEGRQIESPTRRITLEATGLPAQLEIMPAPADIPLAWRGAEAPSPEALQRIGRGPQLHAPLRLEAVIVGETVVATAAAPSALNAADGSVESVADWSAGALQGSLRLRYSADGAISGELSCRVPGGTTVERLDLVIELAGSADTAIAGTPVVAAAAELPVTYGSLPSGQGVLWRNGPSPAGDGTAHSAPLHHFFLGNGDRGFTWLAAEGATLPLDNTQPSISVERNAAGIIVWRIALANSPFGGTDGTAAFTLLTHPARPRAADRRVQQWQPWPADAAQPALTAAARTALPDGLVRADAGSVHEAAAGRALLAGPAGGAARDAAATLADRVPIGLFRYLAAPHTALAAQLRTDAAGLVSSGGSPAVDRMSLGRALLHDIGVDITALSGPVEAAAILRALEEFGVFSDDGQTEFLPYWRTASILRYGEAFAADGGFEVTEENPAARVRVSAFIRPAAGRADRRQAVLVLVNEGTHPVREQLYLHQPAYLFGGANRIRAADIYNRLDFTNLPEDSDWRREIVVASAIRDHRAAAHRAGQLMDLEDGGFVLSVRTRDDSEIYGLIHIPARGMRILYGSGRR